MPSKFYKQNKIKNNDNGGQIYEQQNDKKIIINKLQQLQQTQQNFITTLKQGNINSQQQYFDPVFNFTALSRQKAIQKIISYQSSDQKHNLIQKYSEQFFIQYFDHQRIQDLVKKIPSDLQMKKQQFVRLLATFIQHQEDQTLYLVISLINVWKKIKDQIKNQNGITISDFTGHICEKISIKDKDKEKLIPLKQIPKEKLKPNPFEIRSIDLEPPVILSQVQKIIPQISKDKKKKDKQIDPSKQLSQFILSPELGYIMTLGRLSSSINIFNLKFQKKKQLIPKCFKSFDKKLAILSIAYSQKQQRIGAVLNHIGIAFWDFCDNFRTQKLIKKTLGNKIFYLQLADEWVTADNESIYYWDLKQENIKGKIEQKQINIKTVNDICQITHIRSTAISYTFEDDSKWVFIYQAQEVCKNKKLKKSVCRFQQDIQFQFKRLTRINVSPSGCHSLYYNISTQLIIPLGYSINIPLYSIDPKSLDTSLIASLQGHQTIVTCISSIPQTDLILSGDDHGNIMLWSLEQMRCQQVIHLANFINSLQYYDGRVFYGDKRINVIKVQNLGLELKLKNDHKKNNNEATNNPHTQVLVNKQKTYNIIQKSQNPHTMIPIFKYYRTQTNQLSIFTRKSCRILSMLNGRTLKIINLFSQQEQLLLVNTNLTGYILINSKGDIIHYSFDFQFKWKINSAHGNISGNIIELKFDRVNKFFLTATKDNFIYIWSQKTVNQEGPRKILSGEQVKKLSLLNTNTINNSNKQQILISNRDREKDSTIIINNRQKQKLTEFVSTIMMKQKQQISFVQLSQYFNFFTTSSECSNLIRIWDYESCKLAHIIETCPSSRIQNLDQQTPSPTSTPANKLNIYPVCLKICQKIPLMIVALNNGKVICYKFARKQFIFSFQIISKFHLQKQIKRKKLEEYNSENNQTQINKSIYNVLMDRCSIAQKLPKQITQNLLEQRSSCINNDQQNLFVKQIAIQSSNAQHKLIISYGKGNIAVLNFTQLYIKYFSIIDIQLFKKSANIQRPIKQNFLKQIEKSQVGKTFYKLKSKKIDNTVTSNKKEIQGCKKIQSFVDVEQDQIPSLKWAVKIHKQSINHMSLFQGKYLSTICIDGYFKLTLLQNGLQCCSLNINYPLPIQWDYYPNKNQEYCSKVRQALFVIDQIINENSSNIAKGNQKISKKEFQALNVSRFLNKIFTQERQDNKKQRNYACMDQQLNTKDCIQYQSKGSNRQIKSSLNLKKKQSLSNQLSLKNKNSVTKQFSKIQILKDQFSPNDIHLRQIPQSPTLKSYQVYKRIKNFINPKTSEIQKQFLKNRQQMNRKKNQIQQRQNLMQLLSPGYIQKLTMTGNSQQQNLRNQLNMHQIISNNKGNKQKNFGLTLTKEDFRRIRGSSNNNKSIDNNNVSQQNDTTLTINKLMNTSMVISISQSNNNKNNPKFNSKVIETFQTYNNQNIINMNYDFNNNAPSIKNIKKIQLEKLQRLNQFLNQKKNNNQKINIKNQTFYKNDNQQLQPKVNVRVVTSKSKSKSKQKKNKSNHILANKLNLTSNFKFNLNMMRRKGQKQIQYKQKSIINENQIKQNQNQKENNKLLNLQNKKFIIQMPSIYGNFRNKQMNRNNNKDKKVKILQKIQNIRQDSVFRNSFSSKNKNPFTLKSLNNSTNRRKSSNQKYKQFSYSSSVDNINNNHYSTNINSNNSQNNKYNSSNYNQYHNLAKQLCDKINNCKKIVSIVKF